VDTKHATHMDKGYERVISLFEKYISYTLLAVGLLFATYQVIELIVLVFGALINSAVKGEFFGGQKGTPIAGLFFNILLLMEVLETVKTFSKGHVIKIKIILIVGIIAITRKLLLADITHVEPMEEIAIGAVILALSAGYFLVSRATALKDPEADSGTADQA
jgi:uncharacterized membrane protein (DUF373 family)